MMRSRLTVPGLMFALLAAPTALAQVQVDVSKVTCEQYLLFKVTDPQKISIWLNGYYHGKSGNTIVDTQRLNDNADKLKSYCFANLKMPIMQAVEAQPDTGK